MEITEMIFRYSRISYISLFQANLNVRFMYATEKHVEIPSNARLRFPLRLLLFNQFALPIQAAMEEQTRESQWS